MQLPKTPADLTGMLLMTLLIRAYGDITTAARRGRLTEHDIDRIERNTLAILTEAEDFSHEIKGYEAEPARAEAIAQVKTLFANVRAGRVKQISGQGG